MLRLLTHRAFERGREAERAEVVEFLRAQADIHRGNHSDAKRRGAINHAADRIRDRATVAPSRP